MEITSKFKEREHFSPLNSPNSTTTTTTSCNNNNNINNINTNNNAGGVGIPITRSDPNSPYPTTFVTADTTSFKQVVQMLTGSSDTTSPRQPPSHHQHHHNHHREPPQQPPSSAAKNFVIPPIRTAPKKQGFKLYERRNSALKNMISPLTANFPGAHHQNASYSPRNMTNMPEILSPSLLDFPSLTLSPVTPLVEDPFDKSSPSVGGGSASSSEEERAIAQKGFYLHPSPMSTPRDSEPQLLPLFPLSSPRVSES